MTEIQTKAKSDLGVRTLSAIVMVAVAGLALWLGGLFFAAFVLAVGIGVLWEWWGLISKFAKTDLATAVWMLGGLIYVGTAVATLVAARDADLVLAAELILVVMAVDIGAYFAGRTFGGRKIAPAISPSKTWSGLVGGMLGATIVLHMVVFQGMIDFTRGELSTIAFSTGDAVQLALIGALYATVAQAGDFFESWMKRRAGVKDSGNLIPGHGGFFDRTDGLIAVAFAGGFLVFVLKKLIVVG